jgi:hypothetical protein
MGLFREFSVYGRGAKGLSMVSVLLGLTRILFTIAHTLAPPSRANWSAAMYSATPATLAALRELIMCSKIRADGSGFTP